MNDSPNSSKPYVKGLLDQHTPIPFNGADRHSHDLRSAASPLQGPVSVGLDTKHSLVDHPTLYLFTILLFTLPSGYLFFQLSNYPFTDLLTIDPVLHPSPMHPPSIIHPSIHPPSTHPSVIYPSIRHLSIHTSIYHPSIIHHPCTIPFGQHVSCARVFHES